MNLPRAAIEAAWSRYAIDLVVPPGWIYNAMDDGIDNIFNFLEAGRTDDYVLSYAPRTLLETFQSEAGHEAMRIIVAHHPQ